MQFLQAGRQLAGLELVRAETITQATQLVTALALGPHEAVLGLDAQLLLGVLALLDPAQLGLALLGAGPLRLDHARHPPLLVLGLAQPLLQAGDMAFERLDGRFGRLGPAREGGLAALCGTSRPPFGQQVAFARASPALAGGAEPWCLAFLRHHLDRQLRRRAGR